MLEKCCCNCKNRRIIETSDEWLVECICQVDNHKQSIFDSCDHWTGEEDAG